MVADMTALAEVLSDYSVLSYDGANRVLATLALPEHRAALLAWLVEAGVLVALPEEPPEGAFPQKMINASSRAFRLSMWRWLRERHRLVTPWEPT